MKKTFVQLILVMFFLSSIIYAESDAIIKSSDSILQSQIDNLKLKNTLDSLKSAGIVNVLEKVTASVKTLPKNLDSVSNWNASMLENYINVFVLDSIVSDKKIHTFMSDNDQSDSKDGKPKNTYFIGTQKIRDEIKNAYIVKKLLYDCVIKDSTSKADRVVLQSLVPVATIVSSVLDLANNIIPFFKHEVSFSDTRAIIDSLCLQKVIEKNQENSFVDIRYICIDDASINEFLSKLSVINNYRDSLGKSLIDKRKTIQEKLSSLKLKPTDREKIKIEIEISDLASDSAKTCLEIQKVDGLLNLLGSDAKSRCEKMVDILRLAEAYELYGDATILSVNSKITYSSYTDKRYFKASVGCIVSGLVNCSKIDSKGKMYSITVSKVFFLSISNIKKDKVPKFKLMDISSNRSAATNGKQQ